VCKPAARRTTQVQLQNQCFLTLLLRLCAAALRTAVPSLTNCVSRRSAHRTRPPGTPLHLQWAEVHKSPVSLHPRLRRHLEALFRVLHRSQTTCVLLRALKEGTGRAAGARVGHPASWGCAVCACSRVLRLRKRR
jgi:hypothetical protein